MNSKVNHPYCPTEKGIHGREHPKASSVVTKDCLGFFYINSKENMLEMLSFSQSQYISDGLDKKHRARI